MWDKLADRLHAQSVAALYLHIPFCKSKCFYCDFSSWATTTGDPVMKHYTKALMQQVDELAAAGFLDSCETAYIGGGTPTLLGEGLFSLAAQVRSVCLQLHEFSSEANPESLTPDLAGLLADGGVTRLSLGVQSFVDAELAALGRIHTSEHARAAIRSAADAKLDVSLDFMCAIPEQTDESWKESLEQFLACGIDHVSVYPLQIEENTVFGQRYEERDPAWHDQDIQAARMLQAQKQLAEAGFERYEVASYARNDKACQHNRAYWTTKPYLGLGTSAASMLTHEGYERFCQLAPQLERAPHDTARVRLVCMSSREAIARGASLAELDFELEFLSKTEAAAEDLMLAARTIAGITDELYEHAGSCIDKGRLEQSFETLLKDGLLERREAAYIPTERGWLVGNELYGALWGLASED
ncbi:MAG: radical SAM family heme chaperone HemW [Atopobiaceae bacterium]|nr:radical SAM family heme chaperone HemW [Atopobiaceae bacterium]